MFFVSFTGREERGSTFCHTTLFAHCERERPWDEIMDTSRYRQNGSLAYSATDIRRRANRQRQKLQVPFVLEDVKKEKEKSRDEAHDVGAQEGFPVSSLHFHVVMPSSSTRDVSTKISLCVPRSSVEDEAQPFNPHDSALCTSFVRRAVPKGH